MAGASKKKKIAIFVGIAAVVFGAVFLGITLTKDVGKTQDQITGEEAEKKIGDLLSQIKVESVSTKKAPIDDNDLLSEEEELPDIDKNYPLTVTGSGNINIEIKSGGDLFQLESTQDLYKLLLAIENSTNPVYLVNFIESNYTDLKLDYQKYHAVSEKVFHIPQIPA